MSALFSSCGRREKRSVGGLYTGSLIVVPMWLISIVWHAGSHMLSYLRTKTVALSDLGRPSSPSADRGRNQMYMYIYMWRESGGGSEMLESQIFSGFGVQPRSACAQTG